MIINKQRLFL